MTARAWMLGSMLALAPLRTAHAQDAQSPAQNPPLQDAHAPTKGPVAQQIDTCKQQAQQQGKDPGTSTVACAVKVIFQSRIRRNNRTKPVEMTVSTPPMLTDDTGTPGPGDWEIDLGIQSQFVGGEHRTAFPTININYGAGDRLQFNYAVPYAFVTQSSTDGTPGQSANGFGYSVFGVKYRFYDNPDTGLSFAVAPQLELRTPGSSDVISPSATGVILPVMMTKEYEHLSISADLGLQTFGGDKQYFASFGAGKRLTDSLAFLAEVAGVDINSPGDKHILLNVGLRDKLNETQAISGAIGHDICAGSNEKSLTYLSIYYTKLFGK